MILQQKNTALVRSLKACRLMSTITKRLILRMSAPAKECLFGVHYCMSGAATDFEVSLDL